MQEGEKPGSMSLSPPKFSAGGERTGLALGRGGVEVGFRPSWQGGGCSFWEQVFIQANPEGPPASEPKGQMMEGKAWASGSTWL